MSNYSEIIVFFLMVPVLLQIILPLLMLAGYGIIHMAKVLFVRPVTDAVPADDSHPAAEKYASQI